MATPLPLPELVSQSSTRQMKYRVLKAQFGDGYQQVAPDGINSKVEMWSMRYENIDLESRDAIVEVLDTVAGWDILSWTPVNDTVEKFYRITREGYTEQQLAGSVFTISFQLEQVFL